MDNRAKYIKHIKKMDIGSLKNKVVLFDLNLRTTKLMTELKHRFDNDGIDEKCENAFDVLFIDLIRKKYNACFTLGRMVVLYFPYEFRMEFFKNINFADRTITFTNFKKKGMSFWGQKCINEPYDIINLSNGTKLKLWEKPFVLEAVTDYDKDFRKEWNDGWLEYEGNEYGDTSRFYIIGCIDNTF